jgi:hypothetical protein
MDTYVPLEYAWPLNATVIAFYSVLFVIIYVVKAAQKGKLVVDGSLVVSNVLTAAWEGFRIPLCITVLGVFVSGLETVVYEPRDYYYEEPELGGILAQLILVVHSIMFVVLGLAILYYTARGIHWVFRAFKRLVVTPVVNGIVRIYRAVRPSIPVRWS